MKTPSAILLAVVFAAVAAFVTYKVVNKEQPGTSYVFQTPNCGFVKLKSIPNKTEEETVKIFEALLQSVDQKAGKGTVVNLRYHNAAGKEVEDTGPSTTDGSFSTGNPSANCPDGSMHNTQRVNTGSQKEYKEVLDSLDFSTTSASATSTPTP